MEKITEASSVYNDLEHLSTKALLEGMNVQDQLVPLAIAQISNELEAFIDACFERMKQGGRLIYIGAGTSGRCHPGWGHGRGCDGVQWQGALSCAAIMAAWGAEGKRASGGQGLVPAPDCLWLVLDRGSGMAGQPKAFGGCCRISGPGVTSAIHEGCSPIRCWENCLKVRGPFPPQRP